MSKKIKQGILAYILFLGAGAIAIWAAADVGVFAIILFPIQLVILTNSLSIALGGGSALSCLIFALALIPLTIVVIWGWRRISSWWKFLLAYATLSLLCSLFAWKMLAIAVG